MAARWPSLILGYVLKAPLLYRHWKGFPWIMLNTSPEVVWYQNILRNLIQYGCQGAILKITFCFLQGTLNDQSSSYLAQFLLQRDSLRT